MQKKLPRNLSGEVFERLAGFRRPPAAKSNEKQANEALSIFQKQCPNAEITLLSGGQPVYYYMISAE